MRGLDGVRAPDGREVRFRTVRDSDREFLYLVYASTREEELAPLQWRVEEKETFLRMQFAAQDTHYRTHFPDCEFLAIVVGGVDVGRLYVVRGDDEIQVVDIALLPIARGQGVGSAILGAILAEACRAGMRVSLHVERFNPALRLYERLGFRRVADDGVYLKLEWRPPAAAGERPPTT